MTQFETSDEVKNYDFTEGGYFVESFVEYEFLNATLFTTSDETSLSFNKKGENPQISTKKIEATEILNVSTAHNKEKKRFLDATKPYFHALEITDVKGTVTPTGQKKFKQINKYIEIIDSLLKEIELPENPVIADFGSGKGYLTFALYNYLKYNNGLDVTIVGIELRKDLVDLLSDFEEHVTRKIRLNIIADVLEHLEKSVIKYECPTCKTKITVLAVRIIEALPPEEKPMTFVTKKVRRV